MAETIVNLVLDKLADVVLEEVLFLYGVRDKVERVKRDLTWIQSFVKDADRQRHRNERVKAWVNEVQEVGYLIEDLLDKFLVEVIGRGRREGLCNKLKRIGKMPMKLIFKEKIGSEIEKIHQRLVEIKENKEKFGLDLEETSSGASVEQPIRPFVNPDIDETKVIGFEVDKKTIVDQLIDTNNTRRAVISIVGVGGSGKTTLAKEVYKSFEVQRHFDISMWLTISQENKLIDILLKMLKEIGLERQNEREEYLITALNNCMRERKYLIVLDDVWPYNNVWTLLQAALPDANNGSRVLITTRFIQIAEEADIISNPYKINPLNEDESKQLLLKKVFPNRFANECPNEVLFLVTKFTQKCRGWPLSLVVLGGILSRKNPDYITWDEVMRKLDRQDEGSGFMDVISTSYEDLPTYLKPCFMYFGVFPEDHQIKATTLIQLWIAEGFIRQDGIKVREDIAENYLEELVQRSLIQGTKKSWNGYYKYCNMHHLLRELAITKAKEENFFTVFSKEDKEVNQLHVIKPRRVALQFCTLTDDGVFSENTRSLLCFGFGHFSSKDCGFNKLNFNGFTLLRVLTLQSVVMTKFTERQWPKDLKHLRYLGLRDCRIPKDFFKNFSFYNLETIDLKGSDSHEPDMIVLDVVIPTLKHLYGAWDFYFRLKWDQHTNLQTLNYVHKKTEILELGCCINLRTLVIYLSTYSERVLQMWQDLKGVLSRTEQLVYLGILAGFGLLPFGGTTDLPCHGKIQNLNLKGKWVRDICVPSVEMFPTNLTKLMLILSNLEEDPMPILEKLLSLRILHLGCYSYVGTKLICSTGGFPNLKKLKLIHLPYLCHWDIEEGAMPVLRHLIIDACKRLNALPKLQKVQTLQELVVTHPSRELHESIQGDKDLHKIKHIPFVRIGR